MFNMYVFTSVYIVKTREVFLCFVAIVRVRVYYVDFFDFFLFYLTGTQVSQVLTTRMNLFY